MDDRIDWADVAAVGMVARDWFDDFREDHCVRALLEHESHAFVKGLSVYQSNVDRIAAALREAFEEGQKEGRKERARFTPAEVADRMMMLKNAVDARELEDYRTLRRELAARRAVDGWLQEREGMRAIGWIDGLLTALDFDDNGDQRFVAQAPNYPALAAALGLDWERDE